MSEAAAWIGLGVVAALGGAGVAVLGKVGLSGMDVTLATTLRSVVMAGALLGVCLLTGRLRGLGPSLVDSRSLTFILLAGASGAVSWLAYFGALKIGGAAQVAAIDRLSLPLVVVFGALFLDERYGWRGWLGVGLVLAGIYLIAADPSAVGTTDAGGGFEGLAAASHLAAE